MSARVKRKPIQRRRTLPKRPIGVPRRGRSIIQAGSGLIPKGRASNLPKQILRRGLRKTIRAESKENVAGRTVRQVEFAQRTGIEPQTFGGGDFNFPSLFGSRRRRTKEPRQDLFRDAGMGMT